VRRRGRDADHLRARLAGAFDFLARTASRLRRTRLSRDRARHARLRPLERPAATGGLRARTDRRRRIELLDSIGARKAIWVGHDWGAPVVWSIAQHHPERCHGVANLCVPYIPEGFAVRTILPLADRDLYPVDKFPFAQWDYEIFYEENFERAHSGFEADVRSTVRALFRAGDPAKGGKPDRLAFVRARGGWFGPGNKAPAVPRDDRVIGEEDEDLYVAALERNGFAGPDSWYMNAEANIAYAERARPNWQLTMPVLVSAWRVRLYLRDDRLAPRRADARPLRRPD
jgi:pimeloyl-ACP methyl ester carboxylesterase